MARSARRKSISNIYHVMLRGINKSRIFHDAEDNRKFIKVLKECQEISEFKLYAYCLMGNHVHLLLQVCKEPLEQVMKRIGTRFVIRYNNKYSRTGHLFQDRYKSEPVDDERYFFTVLRYILYNPVKAGICARAEEYTWSSATDYFRGGGITDTSFAENISGREALLAYLRIEPDDVCMDDDDPVRISDADARKIILQIADEKEMKACLNTVAANPEKYVRRLRREGLSIRQISRITGISVAFVRKYDNN